MLVLERRLEEAVTITVPPSAVTQTIKIKVLHLTAGLTRYGKPITGRCDLGFDAPRHIEIQRDDAVQGRNRNA